MMRYQLKPIKTKKDYEKALVVIDELWDAKPKTKEGDMLDIIVTLVEAYEQKHHPIYPPNPIAAILFRTEQLGLAKADLAKLLGGKNRVSEILKGKRKLTLKMVRNLHDKLQIPYESLIAA